MTRPNIICEYVYLQNCSKGRYPQNRDFEPKEFTKIFQEIDNTIELVFHNGINWRAFANAFKESNVQIYNTKGEEIFLREYKALDDGLIILTISIPDGLNEDKIKDNLIHQYKLKIAEFKGTIKAQDKMLATLYERMLLPQTQVNLINHEQSKMFKKEKLQVLQSIIKKSFTKDSQLSEALQMDIHEVRLILDRLQKSGFIKIIKHKQHQDLTQPKIDAVLVTEVTSTGHLASKGDILLEDELDTNQNITINSGNIGIAHMSGGAIQDRAKIAGVINEAEEKNLNQLVEEIQDLLSTLEQTNPSNTRKEKFDIADKAIEHIKKDYNLAQRIISALEKGLIDYLKARLISPVNSFFIATLEDWQKTKK